MCLQAQPKTNLQYDIVIEVLKLDCYDMSTADCNFSNLSIKISKLALRSSMLNLTKLVFDPK